MGEYGCEVKAFASPWRHGENWVLVEDGFRVSRSVRVPVYKMYSEKVRKTERRR